MPSNFKPNPNIASLDNYLREEIANRLSPSDERNERIEIAKNPLLLIDKGYLYILTKDEQLIPLKENRAQKKIRAKIEEIRATGKPVRLWILKGRQMGSSTEVEGLIFCETSQNPNVTSLIVADQLD